MERNKVSVIIPVYNAGKYISETMDSMLTQTYSDFEIICVDDCSTDSTWGILQEYEQKDSRVKVFRNEQNLKIVKTLNKLLSLVSDDAKYIARMDADDISLPERLKEQVDFMEQNPDIDICGTWFEKFGSEDNVIEHPTFHDEIAKCFQKGCVIAHPSVMIRKDFIDGNNIQYNSEYKVEDYELWARCLVEHNARFANIPKVLLKYRSHSEQLTKINDKAVYDDNQKIKEYIFKSLPLGEKLLSFTNLNTLRRFLIQIRLNRKQKIIKLFGFYLLNK